MKVAINSCYGGFSLSPAATVELFKRGGPVDATPLDEYWKPETSMRDSEYFGREAALRKWHEYKANPEKVKRDSLFITVFNDDETLVLNARDAERHDPLLIAVIEELGEASWGACARLKVVEIPDGTEYVIQEYDGLEHIAEKHETWG
jgi:hypothetical protein